MGGEGQSLGRRPFEVDPTFLREHLDERVPVTVSDLVSEFLLLPKGAGFVEYADFRDALAVLQRHTRNFSVFSAETVGAAIRENSRVFAVLRAILGMTPPEWADLASLEVGAAVGQGPARTLDRKCRADAGYVGRVERRYYLRQHEKRTAQSKEPVARPKMLEYIDALVAVAVDHITRGAPPDAEGLVHRLTKFDTQHGLGSVRHAANEGVPYAMLLYERYLGRPFASHRDAVSELVGEIMENAVEEQ